MSRLLRSIWKILFYFRGYRPQSVSLVSVWRWLSQFPRSSRTPLLLLLDQVTYFSERATVRSLVRLNRTILEKLSADGIGPDKVIYVAFDRAGSSSHTILGLLRDAENLERRGAHLIVSRDAESIQETTSALGSGAIIYVDDFAGSGTQFARNRKWSAQFIAGSFSEFFLAPVICEEAAARMEGIGVVPVADFLHTIVQRPLHPHTSANHGASSEAVVALCRQIAPTAGLGFRNLATMVVFYRNAPNSTPLVLRGSLQQHPYRGIFPRSDDLPYP